MNLLAELSVILKFKTNQAKVEKWPRFPIKVWKSDFWVHVSWVIGPLLPSLWMLWPLKPPFWQLGSIFPWFVEPKLECEVRKSRIFKSNLSLKTDFGVILSYISLFRAEFSNETWIWSQRKTFFWLFWVNKHVTNLSDTREIQSWPEPKWN